MKCFDFSSMKKSLENNYSWINFSIYTDLLSPMEKHDDFIKISYCIFKLHKSAIQYFYEK